jgi:hypothetical protein
VPLAVAVAALAVLAALLGAGVGDGADSPARNARTAASAAPAAAVPVAEPVPAVEPFPVSVRVNPQLVGAAIPAGYLGLSFEAADLRRIASYGNRGDFAAMLRSLGPGLLRFGGISADTQVAWSDTVTPRPAWATAVIEEGDFRALRVLAERSGWRVLITVGLAHYEPQAAAREVAAARRLLGPWLAGIEVGNEPDAYARHALRPLPWSFHQYSAEVGGYRHAIALSTGGVPLAGPGVSGSHVFARWGPREAARQQPFLLTGHHYPLGCHQLPPPSIERLLSQPVRNEEWSSLARYMRVARASGIPFRMDEAGSVSCGGTAGISNTFASALWATGYITETLSAGASGINFQGNPANCRGYSPVCAAGAAGLQSGSLTAQPDWYALLLMRGLAGERPLGTSVTAPNGSNLLVHALRAPGGTLTFVIVDYQAPGNPPAGIALHVGSTRRTAAVTRLGAPSLEATAGVRLAGAGVGPEGTLGSGRLTRLAVRHGAVEVTVPAGSAALVTVGS